MKNRFIKTLSVIGMSELLHVNVCVLIEVCAGDDNDSKEKNILNDGSDDGGPGEEIHN